MAGDRQSPDTQNAKREKTTVALTSVVAAVFLTSVKLVIGLMTNSLGILSEAAHSGLDLVAAVVTWMAVRLSDRPADREHHYGHGKIENLSALIESLLLLITCVWIIYEAVNRIWFKTVDIEASGWAFIVMIVSIAVDWGRSRALYRAAKKHQSQALEADALHFSTDIWSSAVVIAGLILVRLAAFWPAQKTWLLKADSFAALVVAGIVIWVSLKLGARTVDALLDKAPAGLEEELRRVVSGVEHVKECGALRLRTAGSVTFIEVTVLVAPDLPTALSHEIATHVERTVLTVCPRGDVTVHIETTASDSSVESQVRKIAARIGLGVHDIRIQSLGKGYHADLDIEVEAGLSVGEAHRIVTEFEKQLRREVKKLLNVESHIEVAPPSEQGKGKDITAQSGDMVRQIRAIVRSFNGIGECHKVRIRQVVETLYVSMHCTCPPGITMEEAHRRSMQLEARFRETWPTVEHFLIHIEPGAPRPGN